MGETDSDRDKMLLELEQECLEVYRRKVDRANQCRAQLRQTIADHEAELAAICSAMGERPVHIRQVRNDFVISYGWDNLQVMGITVMLFTTYRNNRRWSNVDLFHNLDKS